MNEGGNYLNTRSEEIYCISENANLSVKHVVNINLKENKSTKIKY